MTAVTGRGAPTSEKRAVPRAAPPSGARRAWPWALVAIVVGAAGALAHLPALVVLSGIRVVLLAIAAPQAMVGLTAVAVLFVRPVEHLVLVTEVGYLDEVLIAVSAVTLPVRRLAARQPLRTFPGHWWFVGFAAAGMLSGCSWTSRPACSSRARSSYARA